MALKVKPREVRTFIASCPGWCAAMRTRIQQAATPIEFANLWQGELRPYFGRAWRMVRATLESNGVLRQSLIQLVGSADANALLSNLSGAGQLASLGPLVGISKMARGEINRTAYLEQYGHRGPHELELSIPRPVEDPTWLDQQVAMLVKSPVDVDALLARQRAEFDAAWKRLIQRHPHKRKSLQRQIKLAAASARLREETRSEATRIVWVLRELALRVSEWIDFEDRQDVFFLSLDEMIAVLSGDQAALAFIPARKVLYARYSALPSYPAIIIGRFDPFQWAANPNRRSDIYVAHSTAIIKPAAITGFAGAVGVVEGLVRRLDRVEEGDQLKPGEILVTATTNVGWTPLFTLAAAVVTDVGAPLSHAAIVARELGIPAVVGCGNATLHLHTGDQVRVNGGQGTVEILKGSGT